MYLEKFWVVWIIDIRTWTWSCDCDERNFEVVGQRGSPVALAAALFLLNHALGRHAIRPLLIFLKNYLVSNYSACLKSGLVQISDTGISYTSQVFDFSTVQISDVLD